MFCISDDNIIYIHIIHIYIHTGTQQLNRNSNELLFFFFADRES